MASLDTFSAICSNMSIFYRQSFVHLFLNILVTVMSSNRSTIKDEQPSRRITASYVPLPVALGHKWTGVLKRPRQVRQLNLSVLFAILGAVIGNLAE